MAMGGVVFGLTATGICGDVICRAILAIGIAVFRRLVIFRCTTSAIHGVIVYCATMALHGIVVHRTTTAICGIVSGHAAMAIGCIIFFHTAMGISGVVV
jgi:hypothetical protein